MLEALLTFLKVVSLTIAGIAGIISATPHKKLKPSPEKQFKQRVFRHKYWWVILFPFTVFRIIRGVKTRRFVELRRFKRVFSKRWALVWAVTGFFVAFVLQIIEAKVSHDKDVATQLQTSKQIWLATESLKNLRIESERAQIILTNVQKQAALTAKSVAYLSHIAGEFDTLTIDATFELVSTNSTALRFTKRVADLAHSLNIQGLDEQDPNFVTAEIEVSSLVGADKSTAKPNRGENAPRVGLDGILNQPYKSAVGAGGVYHEGIVGYVRTPSQNGADPTNLIRDTVLSHLAGGMGGIGETAAYDEVFSSNWLASVSSDTNFISLFDCLQLPMLGVRIFSGHTTNLAAADADFFAPPPTFGTIQPTIGYDSVLHGVLINWRIEYPCTEWRQTVRMGTLQDLDAATLCFYLANIPDFLTNDIKPVSLRLKFGKTNIKVSKFELQSYENVEVLFEPTTNILSKNPISHQRDTTESTESYRAAVFKAILPPASYDPIEAENNTSTH
jgi:hypothetical protein